MSPQFGGCPLIRLDPRENTEKKRRSGPEDEGVSKTEVLRHVFYFGRFGLSQVYAV